MRIVRVLIVEDNDNQNTAYLDCIEEFNESNTDLSIQATVCKNADDAINKIAEESFDAAVVDLNLTGANDASGNQVLHKIISAPNKRMAILVVSSTLGSLHQELQATFKSPLLKTFSRADTPNQRIIEHLAKVYRTGAIQILGGTGRLEELLNKLFFEHLSIGFESWLAQGKSCESELLRWTALHLLEHLDNPTHSELFPGVPGGGIYLPAEFYIYPCIRPQLATGDLLQREGELFILLTPACDIEVRGERDGKAQRNVERAVLAFCLPLSQSAFDEKGIGFGKKWSDFEANSKKNKKDRYCYLPGHLSIPESVIDFKQLESVSIEEINSAFTRIATVSIPFIRDIQSRFSGYYSRQGQPSGTWLL